MGMDSSSAQHHHQEMNCSSQTLESMLVMSTKPSQQQENKKPRPADMDSLNCPRCDSTNTKFCYYNNYSLSQPRYFCKSCRRYWTKGGTLRNVPVGGGCRKNKRPSSSSSSCSSASSKQQRSQDRHPTMNVIPSLISGGSNPLSSSAYDSNDLTLAIARLQSQEYNDFSIWGNPNMPHHHHQHQHHSDGFDLETPPNGIENFYYGNVGMENGGLEMGMGMGIGMTEEMGIPFEEFTTAASTAVKQEICGGGGMREGEESSKVLFGFPWLQNGGGGGNSNNNNNSMGEFDSGRSLSWNGISNGSSNWHGLLNSPLM